MLIIYIRLFVKEPTIWVESRRQQTQQGREVMASVFVTYYANYALFATHLQLDLKRYTSSRRNHLPHCCPLEPGDQRKGPRRRLDRRLKCPTEARPDLGTCRTSQPLPSQGTSAVTSASNQRQHTMDSRKPTLALR